MPKYDPNSEPSARYGLSSVDLPVTAYDRPSLMMGNLLRGDIDGLTRAMLSPDTLSPSQLKTVTAFLTKGKKPSPVMKTILDIATNPLVIIGLVAGLMYPVGTTNAILQIRKGLLPKAAAMGKMMGHLHGALMKLRTIPGAFESLLGVTRETEKFIVKYGDEANSIFRNAGPMSKAEGFLVSARLDGLHKPTHYMVKALQNEPEFVSFMGGKDVPIAPNIQNIMGSRLMSVSDKLRGFYKSVWDKLMSNETFKGNIGEIFEKKGLDVGGFVDDFHPRRGSYDKYYQASLRGSQGVNYRKHLRSIMFERVGREEIKRTGGMFAALDDLRALEDAGAIKKGFNDQVIRPVLERWSRTASNTVGQIWDDIGKLGLDDVSQRKEFIDRVTDYYTKGAGKNLNFVGRLGNTKRANETLNAMAAALQDAKFSGPEMIQTEMLEIGKTLAQPAQYSLNPWESLQGYVNSVGSDWAFHGTGLGKKLKGIIDTPGVFKNAPHLETYLVDNLMPQVLGHKSWTQVQRSLNDAVRKEKIFNWINVHPMVKETLGPEKSKILLDWFSKSGSTSSEALGARVAQWFHLSTLGLNISATSANAMQNFITTFNNVGMRGMYRGLMGIGGEKGLIAKFGGYLDDVGRGANSREAFNSAFPEFVSEMGEMSKTAERMLAGDVASSGMVPLFKVKGIWDKVKTGIMAPFSKTEVGNQLLAFYSGRNQHVFNIGSKLATASAGSRQALLTEANQVGGSLALLTQFAGGPLGIPSAVMNMNPMWRQYMHFPMRYLGYLHGTLRMGADPSKLDFGSIGRALAGSTAAYIAARNMLGIDIGRGLLFGALPIPEYEKAPFYPWPLAPPAAAILGTAGMALLKGDASNLGAVGAMLVPAGIELRRAYKSLAPRYADYQNRTEEGRIPLYNNDKALIGTLSPMELTLQAIGLRPASVSAEAGAAKWLVSQRDRIRQYRREYTQALFENETAGAERINREFQKVYPELGPLQIKKSDITALENRREISRLQRIERGIPTAYRPIFSQLIGEAGLGQVAQDIEIGGLGTLQNYLQAQ